MIQCRADGAPEFWGGGRDPVLTHWAVFGAAPMALRDAGAEAGKRKAKVESRKSKGFPPFAFRKGWATLKFKNYCKSKSFAKGVPPAHPLSACGERVGSFWCGFMVGNLKRGYGQRDLRCDADDSVPRRWRSGILGWGRDPVLTHWAVFGVAPIKAIGVQTPRTPMALRGAAAEAGKRKSKSEKRKAKSFPPFACRKGLIG